MKPIAPIRPSLRPRSTHAFTLIELLVVVSIIALLAAFSISGFARIIKIAHDKAAKIVCVQIATAIQQYHGDYDTLPETGAGDDWEGDTKSADCVAVLADVGQQGDSGKNPRHTKYLDGMKQAKKGRRGLQDGIDYETDPARPAIYDPYGREYKVKMDTNFDGLIENPDAKGADTMKSIHSKSIIWTAGRDGNWETWDDNVKSW